MRKILVTGGLGYVGGRISSYLSNSDEYFVRVGTHSDTAKPVWLKNGEVAKCDLLDEKSIDESLDGIDTVIHLAALNEIDSGKYPDRAILVGGIGTLNLLRACEKKGVKRFIYFSTAHIYGAPLAGFIDEKILPRPVHPYAISHKIAEDLILAYHDKNILDGIVFRLSNSFGRPMFKDVNRWTLVVNDLCKQAVTSHKLVLKSSGLQKRDFITLSDVENAVEYFLKLSRDNILDGVFNLGGENTMSIKDMTYLIADRCKKVLGFRPEIVIPDKNEEIFDLEYRVDKLKSTGFVLQNNINKEIDDFLIFCEDNFGEK